MFRLVLDTAGIAGVKAPAFIERLRERLSRSKSARDRGGEGPRLH